MKIFGVQNCSAAGYDHLTDARIKATTAPGAHLVTQYMKDSADELRELLEKIRLRVVEIVRRTERGHLLDKPGKDSWFTHTHVTHVELGKAFHWSFAQDSRGEHRISFSDARKEQFLFEFKRDPNSSDPRVRLCGTVGRRALPCYREEVIQFRRLLKRILKDLHNIPWMLLDDLASI